MHHYRLIVLAALLATPASLAAQVDCRPTPSSNEARLMAFYSMPIEFTSLFAATPAAGHLLLGVEATYVPSASADLRKTDQCFTAKSENTQLSHVLPRPRVMLGLPGGIALEASWLPPVKVAGAEPNLFGVALIKSVRVAPSVGLQFRAYSAFGRVRGAITCPQSALQTSDVTQPCYGTQPSQDTFHPTNVGGEMMAVVHVPRSPVTFTAGGGVMALRPRFQVGFTDGTGFTDSTHITVNLSRVSLSGGVHIRATRSIELAALVYSVPSDGVTGRLGVAVLP